MPLAPGRFSTTICCPSRSLIFGAASRLMRSMVFPGGKGTIIFIGLLGYGCAWARETNNARSKKRISILRYHRQQNEGLPLEVQRDLAAKDLGGAVERIVVQERAAAFHRVLH